MHLYAHLSFTTYCVIILLRPVLNRTYSTKITRHTVGNLSLQRISIAITLIHYSILFLPWQYLYAFYYVNFLLTKTFVLNIFIIHYLYIHLYINILKNIFTLIYYFYFLLHLYNIYVILYVIICKPCKIYLNSTVII